MLMIGGAGVQGFDQLPYVVILPIGPMGPLVDDGGDEM